MRTGADRAAYEPSGEAFEEAVRRLSSGEVVAVPTDTVYGLAVALRQTGAAQALFALKGRPDTVALPVLVASTEEAIALSHPEDRTPLGRLGAAFWPGDLTVVVRRGAPAASFPLGGDPETIGLRVPAAPIVAAIARRVGPLGVSSANRHGEPPCQAPEQVQATFGEVLYILDGGLRTGTVSTVVDVRGGALSVLRPGRIDRDSIAAALGAPPSPARPSK